jgi:hypothetical protein
MRKYGWFGLGLLLLCGVRAASASVPAPEWPETREGVLARGWVLAFSTGETSMATFFEFNLAPASLARRTMADRMAAYRSLHRRLGALRLAEVTSAAPGELRVVLVDARENERHDTVFRVQTEEPRKLLAVELTLTERHRLFGH